MQATASRSVIGNSTLHMLRLLTALTLLLLAAQFLIGMVANLYVTVPSVHPGANASDYFTGVVQGVIWALFHSSWILIVHVALGLLLFLATLMLLGISLASRRRIWIITSLLGFMGIMGAGFNGASFLNYGHDFSSLLMSIGFLLAAIAYTISFSFTREAR